MPLNTEHINHVAEVSERVMYSGAASAIVFGLTASEIGILVGSVVGVAGFLVSWYYKHKAYVLKKGLHDKLMDEEE